MGLFTFRYLVGSFQRTGLCRKLHLDGRPHTSTSTAFARLDRRCPSGTSHRPEKKTPDISSSIGTTVQRSMYKQLGPISRDARFHFTLHAADILNRSAQIYHDICSSISSNCEVRDTPSYFAITGYADTCAYFGPSTPLD